ncbi:MAG: hypothetical protein ACXAEU_24090 [Candidatus Hodarchaeales archaeon]
MNPTVKIMDEKVLFLNNNDLLNDTTRKGRIARYLVKSREWNGDGKRKYV